MEGRRRNRMGVQSAPGLGAVDAIHVEADAGMTETETLDGHVDRVRVPRRGHVPSPPPPRSARASSAYFMKRHKEVHCLVHPIGEILIPQLLACLQRRPKESVEAKGV